MKTKNKTVQTQAQTKPNPPAPAHPVQQAIDPEKIRCLAYEKWVAAGKPDCDGVAFWLEAERECAFPKVTHST